MRHRGQNGVRAGAGVAERRSPAFPGITCVLAGHGDAVAVVGLGDDPDGGIPMTGLWSDDGEARGLPR